MKNQSEALVAEAIGRRDILDCDAVAGLKDWATSVFSVRDGLLHNVISHASVIWPSGRY